MKIGINATQLLLVEKSGISFAVEELVRALIQLTRDTGDELVLYLPRRYELQTHKNVTLKVLHWPGRVLWTQLRLGWELVVRPPDFFLDISNFIPLMAMFSRARRFFVTHDLAFLDFPRQYTFRTRTFLTFGHWYSGLLSERVFAVSEYTRSRIEFHFPQWISKTTVVEFGLRKSFLENLKNAEDSVTPHDSEHYLLFVGRIDPKKNLEQLILGFHQWNKNHFYRLLLCGSMSGWHENQYVETLKQLTNHLQITERVEFTGFVSDQKLAELYACADAVVLPSFGEGFGLPIIEGLAAGKRVMVSEKTGGISSALKERLVFCRHDASGIAEGLDRLISSSTPKALEWSTFDEVAKKIYQSIII